MNVSDLDSKQARRLIDILNYARLGVEFAKGIQLDDFKDDRMRQLSLERCFEIIGEAARHITPETAEAAGGLPLQEMRGMRNLISHDYNNVHPRIVLRTAQENLPVLVGQLGPLEKQLCSAANLQFPVPRTFKI